MKKLRLKEIERLENTSMAAFQVASVGRLSANDGGGTGPFCPPVLP
jgi:hypothetical protein